MILVGGEDEISVTTTNGVKPMLIMNNNILGNCLRRSRNFLVQTYSELVESVVFSALVIAPGLGVVVVRVSVFLLRNSEFYNN